MIAPLVITWVICINGALKAPIDKRFRGIKARALVALLIYLGPILRGYERIKWRLRETRPPPPAGSLEQAMQKPRLSLRERAFYLSYWSERGDEKEALLGGLMRFLVPQKYFVIADQGWDEWDLKIARGLWTRALVLVCTENHGAEKRLLARALRHAAVALRRVRAARLRAGDGGGAHPRARLCRARSSASSASRTERSSPGAPSRSAGSCTASSRPWRGARASFRCSRRSGNCKPRWAISRASCCPISGPTGCASAGRLSKCSSSPGSIS